MCVHNRLPFLNHIQVLRWINYMVKWTDNQLEIIFISASSAPIYKAPISYCPLLVFNKNISCIHIIIKYYQVGRSCSPLALGNNASRLHFDSKIKVQDKKNCFNFNLNLKWTGVGYNRISKRTCSIGRVLLCSRYQVLILQKWYRYILRIHIRYVVHNNAHPLEQFRFLILISSVLREALAENASSPSLCEAYNYTPIHFRLKLKLKQDFQILFYESIHNIT